MSDDCRYLIEVFDYDKNARVGNNCHQHSIAVCLKIVSISKVCLVCNIVSNLPV